MLERIGAGGQATVYLGHDTVLDSRVAVKVMHQVATSNEEYVEALRAEASTARILSHSNIAPIYDFTVEDDYACIVMEYFPNSVDKELVNSGPIPHSRATEIIVAVCQALSNAHEIGFVHRDIKPHNILLAADGTPKVTDFGISRASDLSVGTSSMGTPLYMSPEQCMGEESIDVRTDIYSVGITLFEMLTGKPPFEGTAPQLYQMHQNAPVPPVADSLGVPSSIENVIQKCMAKNPNDRFQNMQEIISALQPGNEVTSLKGIAPLSLDGKKSDEADESSITGDTWRRQGQ